MFYNIIKIVNYMGPHRVHNNWMYQDFVLFLACWWLVVAETCCQVFNFTDLMHFASLTVINCYIIPYSVISSFTSQGPSIFTSLWTFHFPSELLNTSISIATRPLRSALPFTQNIYLVTWKAMKPWVHDFSKNLEATSKHCSRRVTQCKFHIEDIFVTTTHGSRDLCTPAWNV